MSATYPSVAIRVFLAVLFTEAVLAALWAVFWTGAAGLVLAGVVDAGPWASLGVMIALLMAGAGALSGLLALFLAQLTLRHAPGTPITNSAAHGAVLLLLAGPADLDGPLDLVRWVALALAALAIALPIVTGPARAWFGGPVTASHA